MQLEAKTKMDPFIYGERNKINIIDLSKTLPMLKEALVEVERLIKSRRFRKDDMPRILFVGTKYAASEAIKEQATRAGMPYVNHRWLGGMLTNWKTIRQSVKD